MAAIITNKFRIHNAEQFYEAFGEAAPSRMYLMIGRSSPWTDENAPPTPVDTVQARFDDWDRAIAIQSIAAGSVSHVIPRKNWTTGTTYTMFDYAATNLFTSTAGMIVMNSNYDVYKCLFNGTTPAATSGIASTIEPTGTASAPFTTADTYIWQYMYTIPAADILKFVSTDWISCATNSTVSTAAVDGSIDVIKVTAVGSGYTSVPTVAITGDGTGATATATLTSQTVTKITVTAAGSGYTFAKVAITGGGGSAATATAMVGPFGGHGHNAVEECGAYYVMMNSRLEYAAGSGDFPVDNDFRTVAVVRDPLNEASPNAAATATTLSANPVVAISSVSGTFQADEIIVGGSSSARARVVSPGTTSLRYYQDRTANDVNYYKNFTSSETITGQTSNATGTAGSTTAREVKLYTGDVVYAENRRAINRAADQIEDIKLVIEF